ncbi:cell wall-active antibiotics response protein [Cohnella xylanilytica]|uniref:Cell wall-active antibiotics response protein n=1 Tax=Cohnella xylanilytica TaxID=557555 RepID=A0A841TU26_9BACL|nr:cell wall-active antibiotics response protein LiaF [Cohnella xylanilytica]MBB6691665.1 cell wall-active antibiotics response protein [Cohnella xylanilytica]
MQQSVLHRIFWGIVLVGGGVVFLLNQTGAISIDIGELFRNFWPIILILVGVQGLLIQRQGGFWWNPIVILVGVFFLGKNMGWVEWDFGDLIRFAGPVILIVYGLCLMTRGGRSRAKREEPNGWNSVTPQSPPSPPPAPGPDMGPPPPPPPYDAEYGFGPEPSPQEKNDAGDRSRPPFGEGSGPSPSSGPSAGPSFREMPSGDPRSKEGRHWKHQYWKEHHQPPWKSGYQEYGREDHSRFIGDFVIGQDYFELRPMSISHFIGDTKLDLTRAQIPLGETKIYVSSFIGDVKVFVPNDFSVGVRVVSSSLVGDVKVMEQKRGGLFNQMNVETPGYIDASRQIVLIVSTFIGDVRVTKVG